jgi:hypothetical protein
VNPSADRTAIPAVPTWRRRSDVSFEDEAAAQDYLAEHGLTDGLPVVLPIPERVDAMVATGDRSSDEELGRIPGRASGLTVEQAAVCAVMAGALPAYFPVVLATWDAIFDPALNGNATLGSSGSTAITGIVSGPYADVIGMNSGHNMLGPGNRPNATIGRAVRLGLRNGLDYRTGQLDGAAFGNQARYTAHFAERTQSAWHPLRVRHGYPRSATTVTVAVTDAPRQLMHGVSDDARRVMQMFAEGMRDLSHVASGAASAYFLLVGPEHESILVSGGWTPERMAEHLAKVTRVTPAQLEAAGVPFGSRHWDVVEADGKVPSARAEDIAVVSAGGAGAGWSQILFGYAPAHVFRPVTKEVRVP